ncbi:hypothetical protein BC829DRAFT_432888 [Chytridium lagenaria]|nr:hypothetical protein BC829DRAFT_432888 [Chytridium lagenaria]
MVYSTSMASLLLMLISASATNVLAAPSANELLAARSYTPKCASNKPFAIFDPPQLTIDDYDFESNFTVKLSAAPSGPVKLFLDGKAMWFSKNEVAFDPTNWNKPQALSVFTNPDVYENTAVKTILVETSADAPCENYSGCKQEYKGNRKFYGGGTCMCTGDPHCTGFNGLPYTQMKTGAFYMVKSDYLDVQVYQTPCVVIHPHKATCISAVAIKYGDSAAMISTSSKVETATLESKKFNPYLTTSNKWKITLKDKSVITVVTDNNGKGVSWIDVTINLQSGYFSKVGGLCGAHTNDITKKTKLSCSDGRLVSHVDQKLVDQFTDSWAVPASDNLFKGKYQPPTKKCFEKDAKPVPGCKPPVYNTCPPKTTSKITTTTLKPVITTSTSTMVYASTTKTTVLTMTTTTAAVITTTTVAYVPTTTTTTTTSTKTPCTVPPYKPDDHVYQPPATTSTVAATSTVAPVITLTTVYAGKTTTITSTVAPVTTSAPAPAYTQVVSPSNPTDVYVVPAPVPAYTLTTAEETCKKLVIPAGCTAVCPNELKHYISSCVSDMITMGTYSFCESTRQSINDLCDTLSSYMADSTNTTIANTATDIRKDLGYGTATCKNSCSGNGECKSGGCVCTPPFTGPDCSVDMTVLPPAPYYAAPKPASTGAPPPLTPTPP